MKDNSKLVLMYIFHILQHVSHLLWDLILSFTLNHLLLLMLILQYSLCTIDLDWMLQQDLGPLISCKF